MDNILFIPGLDGRGIIDRVPNVVAAYSLRRLSSSYTGPCIRVRRSSDNAEQDIGFVGRVLDTAALLSFVGAGDGFVTTWYEQKFNTNHPVQATTTAQPLIVSSGVLNMQNSRPFVDFLNTSQLLTTSNVTLSRPFTSIVVRTLLDNDSELITSSGIRLQQNTPTNLRIRSNLGSNATTLSNSGTQIICTYQILETPNARLRINGGAFASGNNYTDVPGNSQLILGRAASGSSRHFESIYFNAQIPDATIAQVESDMNRYWSVH
jgi:hypothetical protein